jgi:uncharacterized membrane protein YkoI
MKINRFIALAVIALLVVGAMGVLGVKVFAHQASAQTQDCSQDQDNSTEVNDANPDADNVELQCGDQNAPDGQEDATGVYTDTTEVQEGDQDAPDGQEAVGTDTESTTDAETTALGTPSITVEQAQAAALAAHPGTVIKTELDNENGQLIYSVEINDGMDIKVDAMTGAILATESDQD